MATHDALDTAIARRVFGLRVHTDPPTLLCETAPGEWQPIPTYSADMHLAGALAQQMGKLGRHEQFLQAILAEVARWDPQATTDPAIVAAFLVDSRYAPEMICRAALAALPAAAAPDRPGEEQP